MSEREAKYHDLRAAHAALCLDAGFDPFLGAGIADQTGRRWRKATPRALRALGYVIDPAAPLIHRCAACGSVIGQEEYDGLRYYWPDTCPRHRRYDYCCDWGHRHQMTEAEATAVSQRCPTCGDYFV